MMARDRDFLRWRADVASPVTVVHSSRTRVAEPIARVRPEIVLHGCHANAFRDAQLLRGVEVVQGDSYVPRDWPEPLPHSWNAVDGTHFDHTAERFDQPVAEYAQVIRLRDQDIIGFTIMYRYYSHRVREFYHGLRVPGGWYIGKKRAVDRAMRNQSRRMKRWQARRDQAARDRGPMRGRDRTAGG